MLTTSIYSVAEGERPERPAQGDAQVDLRDSNKSTTIYVPDEDIKRQALAATLRDGGRREGQARVEAFARRRRRQVEAQAARATGLLAEEERRGELLLRRVGVGPALRQGRVRARAAEGRFGDEEGRSGGGGGGHRGSDGFGDGLAKEGEGEGNEGVLHLSGSGL